jgi:hypothetical protein
MQHVVPDSYSLVADNHTPARRFELVLERRRAGASLALVGCADQFKELVGEVTDWIGGHEPSYAARPSQPHLLKRSALSPASFESTR